MVVDNSEVAEVLGGYAPRWIPHRHTYPQVYAPLRQWCLHTLYTFATTAPPRHKRARNHAEKSVKNLIYALHSSKVVLLCVHRLLRIVAVPPCTKKRTVPIPCEGTNRKNQGDKV